LARFFTDASVLVVHSLFVLLVPVPLKSYLLRARMLL
jgi:hypothetical protein